MSDPTTLDQILSDFVHDAVFKALWHFEGDITGRCLAIPYFFQQAIVRVLQKNLDLHNQVKSGLVGNSLSRFMGMEVVAGYEIAVVIFHRDIVLYPEQVYRVNFSQEFLK